MKRSTCAWLAVVAAVSVFIAVQVVSETGEAADRAFVAQADIPTVAPGSDVLAGIVVLPSRVRGNDYRRDAFGESWDDDNDAPGGRNGCDTRNDILDRDLIEKAYVAISRCPTAVATGTLRDPYTSQTIPFMRGNQTGAVVQIDHLVPLAYAWDMGARNWTDALRLRFANDPANLLAVDGPTNQDKGDAEPALWMPPNEAFHCQYAVHPSPCCGLRAGARRAVGAGPA